MSPHASPVLRIALLLMRMMFHKLFPSRPINVSPSESIIYNYSYCHEIESAILV